MVPGHLTRPLVHQKSNLASFDQTSAETCQEDTDTIYWKLMFLGSTVLCCTLAQAVYTVEHNSCISYTIEVASQLKNG